MIRLVTACALALFCVPSDARAQVCAASPMTVQILGSGGPRTDGERASASYLLWMDGQARMQVDAGGGAYLRFGQAQARLRDLWLLGVSHLHPDHTSDLPALLWLSEQGRKESLSVAGPSGNDAMPAFPGFLESLFGANGGAFRILSGTVGGAGRGVPLDVSVVDVTEAEPSTVLDRPEMTVTALGIPHGNIPALAYRVQAGDRSVVFSTDQNGTNPAFTEFARDADALVMHLAVAGGNSPLHASPAVVGRVAQEAGVGRLILSHIGLFDLEPAVADVRQFYTGPLTVGADLQCTPVP